LANFFPRFLVMADDVEEEQVPEVAKGQKGEQARAMQNLDVHGAETEMDSDVALKVLNVEKK
jgi:hypothetical protein